MGNQRNFILRLHSWWGGLRSGLRWLVGGSIVAFILGNLTWEKYIKPFIDKCYSIVKIEIFSWISNHPIGTVIITFFIVLLILLIHAYITTMPPKGIEVSYEERDDGIILFISNNTKNDLINAYLQVNWIKPEPEPALTEERIDPEKLLWGAPIPEPHFGRLLMWEVDENHVERTILESTKSVKSHSIRVEIGGRAGFWVSMDTAKPLIYFDEGQVNAEIQFGGTKPNGDVVTKEFELIIDYDGRNVKMKKIWQ